MSVLDQCMDIIQLTSLDWPEEERYGFVGHSFRVMAKARNYDEMVVGLMHALYAASSSTRGLYSCDVSGDPEWKTALDLFVHPLKLKKFRSHDSVSDEYLLNLNMPQNLSDEEREKWMLAQTVWSDDYSDYIRKIRCNRIARNVMIHKLEDMLDVLENPGIYEDESGPQHYVLPWKKHQNVELRMGRSTIWHKRIPITDDYLLFRNPTDEERSNLIDKYDQALEMLCDANDRYLPKKDFTGAEMRQHEVQCHKWFLDWMDHMEYLKEISAEKEDEGELESEELPF